MFLVSNSEIDDTHRTGASDEAAKQIASALSTLRRRSSRRADRSTDHPHGRGNRGSGALHGGFRGHGGRAGGLALIRMLEALSNSPDALGVSDIGEAVRVDQPRASRLVQQAAERGLVRREADPNDARRTRIALTDEGREFADRVMRERRESLGSALTALTADEQQQLARLLTKLADNW